MSTPSDRELLTPWFPGNVKPKRIGAYKVKGVRNAHGSLLYSSGYAWWNGREWGYSQTTPRAAQKDGTSMRANFAAQAKVWRGLRKDSPQ